MVDNVVAKVEELFNIVVKIFFVTADWGMVGCCVDVKTSAVVNEKLFNCKLVSEGWNELPVDFVDEDERLFNCEGWNELPDDFVDKDERLFNWELVSKGWKVDACIFVGEDEKLFSWVALAEVSKLAIEEMLAFVDGVGVVFGVVFTVGFIVVFVVIGVCKYVAEVERLVSWIAFLEVSKLAIDEALVAFILAVVAVANVVAVVIVVVVVVVAGSTFSVAIEGVVAIVEDVIGKFDNKVEM